MKDRKRLFFSFSLLCLLVLSFCSVGSVFAQGTLTEASYMNGDGVVPAGGTEYSYDFDHVGVLFLGNVYEGNSININSETMYTLFANITEGGFGFEGVCDVYYGAYSYSYEGAFVGFQLKDVITMESNLYYQVGGGSGDYYNLGVNVEPRAACVGQRAYQCVKLTFVSADVMFNIYYLFVVDNYLGAGSGSTPPAGTPAVTPPSNDGSGWSGVDWVNGIDFALAPVIVQLLIAFILLLGLPMCLVVLVPKAGMTGFSGVMLVASVACYAFLGFPVWILIFTVIGAGLMLFSLMYRG